MQREPYFQYSSDVETFVFTDDGKDNERTLPLVHLLDNRTSGEIEASGHNRNNRTPLEAIHLFNQMKRLLEPKVAMLKFVLSF